MSHYRRMTADEVTKLLDLRKKGESVTFISERLGFSQDAVRKQLIKRKMSTGRVNAKTSTYKMKSGVEGDVVKRSSNNIGAWAAKLKQQRQRFQESV